LPDVIAGAQIRFCEAAKTIPGFVTDAECIWSIVRPAYEGTGDDSDPDGFLWPYIPFSSPELKVEKQAEKEDISTLLELW